jgi:hypothetical protein
MWSEHPDYEITTSGFCFMTPISSPMTDQRRERQKQNASAALVFAQARLSQPVQAEGAYGSLQDSPVAQEAPGPGWI